MEQAHERDGPIKNCQLRSSQPVRRYQANGSKIAQLTNPDLARPRYWSNIERSIN